MDTYTISPHILVHDDGRILTLPCDDDGRNGLAVFASEAAAADVAPDGFSPVYVGPKDIERVARMLHVGLVALLGLSDDLEGGVFEVDAFIGVLTGEFE